MKILILLIIMLKFFTPCFSQNLNFESNLLNNNITTFLQPESRDSISKDDNVLISISNKFDHVFTTGMRWGTYGALAGWIYAYGLVKSNECDGGLCGLYVPLGFSLGLIGGGIYATSSDIPEDFDASKLRFGFQWGNSGTLAKDRIFWDDIGIVYRQPNNKFYIPDNYYLYFAFKESGNPDYSSDLKSIYLDSKYGIELIKINYKRTYSLMYGLGLGYSSGKIRNNTLEPFNGKGYNSFHIDVRIGLNINILKYVHFQWFYKLEPFGPYNSFTHSIAGSLSCFYF